MQLLRRQKAFYMICLAAAYICDVRLGSTARASASQQCRTRGFPAEFEAVQVRRGMQHMNGQLKSVIHACLSEGIKPQQNRWRVAPKGMRSIDASFDMTEQTFVTGTGSHNQLRTAAEGGLQDASHRSHETT